MFRNPFSCLSSKPVTQLSHFVHSHCLSFFVVKSIPSRTFLSRFSHPHLIHSRSYPIASYPSVISTLLLFSTWHDFKIPFFVRSLMVSRTPVPCFDIPCLFTYLRKYIENMFLLIKKTGSLFYKFLSIWRVLSFGLCSDVWWRSFASQP